MSTEAVSHYKAVCRALVAEAIELSTFLEKIYIEREVYVITCSDESELNHSCLIIMGWALNCLCIA